MLLRLKPQHGAWSLLVLTQFGLALAIAQTRRSGDRSRYVQGRYIVETAPPPPDSNHTFSSILHKVVSHVESHLNIERIHHKFDHDIFTGFSVQLAGNTTHHHLKALDHVVKVHPVMWYDAINGDQPTLARQHHFHPPPHHGHGHAASPSGPSDYAKDVFSPHMMTGVDKLHAKGVIGAGALVCVLDTGVDFKLAALGGCFGSGCHVAVGLDLAGDDGKHRGSTPFGECESHGTHVTGIIGALPNEHGFIGVAPEATLGHFRIFSCEGPTTHDLIIAGLIAAAKSNCDIINMSIGGGGAFAGDNPVELVVNRLAERGVTVMISAGNGGRAGLFTTSSPAIASGAMSVGSVDVERLPAFRLDLEGGGSLKSTSYLASARNSTAPLPVVALSYSTNFDPIGAACVPIPASIDCKDKIVITQLGGCSLVDKLQNVAAAGAKVMAIYHADPTIPLDIFETDDLTVFTVSLTVATTIPLLSALKANPNMKASLSGEIIQDQVIVDTASGGLVSRFSAKGPSGDLLHQGSFCAPGGNIVSTAPSIYGDLAVMSGTSMAAPFAAGAAALLLSGRRSENLKPEQIRTLLATTAKPLTVSRNGTELVSTLRQGAGLIQVDQAFEAKTFISPIALSLNDTDHPQLTHEIQITNTNEFDVTYTFSSRAAQSLAAYNNSAIDDILPARHTVVVHGSAEVMFAVPVLRVRAGQSGKMVVTFKPPIFSKQDQARVPFYSGFVMIKSDECAQINYSIPYFGMGSRMVKLPILDTTSTFTDIVLGDDGSTGHDYSSVALPLLSTMDDKLKVQVPQTDPGAVVMYHRAQGVAVRFRLAAPTRMLTLDIVHANTTFKANIPRRVRKTQQAGLVLDDLNPTTMHFDDDPDEDDEEPGSLSCPPLSNAQVVGRFAEIANEPRDLPASDNGDVTSQAIIFDGLISKTLHPDNEKTKTPVPAHTPYKVLLRVLKLGADSMCEDSWESWLSKPFAFLD
ncbi:BQ2448_8122 [Microbotryum intermedium]|uniref:BQ2448_8122 protein n=1 Tax=Microbotryum intermedium TaxID=269621 RepID=A0A238FR75_9BASI|nr:BQ2448_8122 [Microbotryum intermedium]